jgi:arylsulfatase A-like enzyme
MGSVASFVSYGQNWASVGNTPLRKWKQDSYEGGINTPLVVHWPAVIKPQTGWNREPAHVIDIMPTVLAVSGAQYPGASKQAKIPPIDGVSLLPAFKGEPIARTKPLFFQFGRGSAMRDGSWKLVRMGATWELYDLAADRNEMHDLAAKRPELVKQMNAAWLAWWKESTGSEWTGKSTKERELEE